MIDKVLANAKQRAENEKKNKADIRAGKTARQIWEADGHSGILED